MTFVKGECLICGGATAGRPDRLFVEDVGNVHGECYFTFVASMKGPVASREERADAILRDRKRILGAP